MTILVLFHLKGYRCLKHFYTEYVTKHMRDMFPNLVSYNRFVELQKSMMLPLAIFVKEVLLGKCIGISIVIRHLYKFVASSAEERFVAHAESTE